MCPFQGKSMWSIHRKFGFLQCDFRTKENSNYIHHSVHPSLSTSVTQYIRHSVHPSLSTSVTECICHSVHLQPTTNIERGIMSKLLERAFIAELTLRQRLSTIQHNFFARLKDDRGDVPGWVLVVLMTTGLVTAIWTIAAPRLTAILKNSLDSMNGIR